MDWSSSQDDDGLESVSKAPGTGANVESTVVVDPISQIPSPHPSFRRETVEKTEVLQGRRIDQLRAEVNRRKKAHARKQQKRLLLWAAAGAGAVSLGAVLAGVVFAPGSEGTQAGAAMVELARENPAPDKAVASPAELAQADGAVQSARGPASKQEQANPVAEPRLLEEPAGEDRAPEQALEQDSGLSLNDLPGEEIPTAEPGEVAVPLGDSGAALSLDDLPEE